MVKPDGYLFVSGVDLDVRTKVARDLGWKPVSDLLREIYEGDVSLMDGWPLEWWGQEPFMTVRPDYTTRHACGFQLGQRRQRKEEKPRLPSVRPEESSQLAAELRR